MQLAITTAGAPAIQPGTVGIVLDIQIGKLTAGNFSGFDTLDELVNLTIAIVHFGSPVTCNCRISEQWGSISPHVFHFRNIIRRKSVP
jgi:hypothetical protein